MAEDKNGPKAKIFIVEDEVLIASDLDRRLTGLNYAVSGRALSGRAALAAVEQDPPDLVLMDIMLKGDMDGIETADIIRSRFQVPVVFVTAHTDDERLERAKLAYPSGYLVKPFNDRDLRVTLEMALFVARSNAQRRKAEAELREKEKRLRKNEAHFRLLAENSTDVIWTLDENFKASYYSPAVTRILGYTPEEMYSLSREKRYTPESLEKISGQLAEMNERIKSGCFEGMEKQVEFEAIRKDGSTVWMEANLKATFDDDHRFLGLVGVSRDISKRKEAEAALRQAFDALEDRVRERTAEIEAVNHTLHAEILQRKKTEGKLIEAQKRVRMMDYNLALTEERERRRIAVDIHDRIGQSLALARLKLKSIGHGLPEPEQGELDQVLGIIDQMIEATRSLTFELSPVVLFELGLEQGLEWLAEQAAQRDRADVRFVCRDCAGFDTKISIIIFRAVQEILMNVTKHARASRVLVEMWTEAGWQMISIDDDGLGFDVSRLDSKEASYKSFGLLSVRERLGSVDGELQIRSKPGEGTRVLMKIPVSPSTKAL